MQCKIYRRVNYFSDDNSVGIAVNVTVLMDGVVEVCKLDRFEKEEHPLTFVGKARLADFPKRNPPNAIHPVTAVPTT